MNEALRGLLVLGSVGFAFSVLLAFLSRKLKVEEDPLVEKIMEILPGINCGACGFSGCKAFAESVVKSKEAAVCKPGGEEVNEQVAALLNVKAEKTRSLKAVVACGADSEEKKFSSEYRGPRTCAAAHLVGGGPDCKYGCIGFGDCIAACPVGGLSMVKGRIIVDIEKCIGCGKCAQVCPRNLFELVPYEKKSRIFYVACSNREKGPQTRKVCSRGCIVCGMCTRVGDSPFYLDQNLSRVSYEKVKAEDPLVAAKDKCPTKCIDSVDV